jgi:hypothetical protein
MRKCHRRFTQFGKSEIPRKSTAMDLDRARVKDPEESENRDIGVPELRNSGHRKSRNPES